MEIETLPKFQSEGLRNILKKMEEEKHSELLQFKKESKSTKEWEQEPDELEWIDSETFLVCRIVRNTDFKTLCGYVAVSLRDKLSREQFDQLKVHGGVTWEEFSDANQVCLFGFHCAHAFDIVPLNYELIKTYGSDRVIQKLMGKAIEEVATYKNIFYVINECKNLARQLKKFEYLTFVQTGFLPMREFDNFN